MTDTTELIDQPEDQTEKMRALFAPGASMCTALLAAVGEVVGRRKAAPGVKGEGNG